MEEIYSVLRQLGIIRTYRCCERMALALMLVMEDEHRLYHVTGIYSEVGKRLGCSGQTVERSMRTGIERAWMMNPEFMREIAGFPLPDRPTVSEFIEIVSSHIIRSEAR